MSGHLEWTRGLDISRLRTFQLDRCSSIGLGYSSEPALARKCQRQLCDSVVQFNLQTGRTEFPPARMFTTIAVQCTPQASWLDICKRRSAIVLCRTYQRQDLCCSLYLSTTPHEPRVCHMISTQNSKKLLVLFLVF